MADKRVIDNLEKRIGQLIADHRRLNRLCGELAIERDTLRQQVRTLQEQMRNLEQQLARAELSEGLSGGGQNRERAKARVNRLMREVDRCIALLNKPTE